MKVLVVFGTHEAPAIQDIYFKNPFGILEKEGKVNFILRELSKFSLKDIYEFNLIIVSRIFSADVLDMIELCNKINKKLLFFFDDDILHFPMAYYLDNEPFYKNNEALIIKILKNSSGLIVSTDRLKETYQEYNSNIHVVFPSLNIQFINESNITRKLDEGDKKFTIGYAGSFGHTVDFKFLEKALLDFYNKHRPHVQIEFMGCIPEIFQKIVDGSSVKFTNWLPNYPDYLRNLHRANWDIALCPVLESDYANHKTSIKFLEYASAKIPGIYSNIYIYNKDVVDSKTGFLADNNYQSWIDKLGVAYKNKKLLKNISDSAFEYVTTEYSDSKAAEAFQNALDNYRKVGFEKNKEEASVILHKAKRFYLKNGFWKLLKKAFARVSGHKIAVETSSAAKPIPDQAQLDIIFDRVTQHFDQKIIKKQVLFIVPWLSVGGGDMVNLILGRQFDPERYTIHFLTTEISTHEWEPKFRNISKNIFHIRQVIEQAEHFWQYNNLILEYIRRANIDIIILSNSSIGYTCLRAIKEQFKDITIIDILHGQGGAREGGGFPEYSQPYRQYLDHRVTINRYLKNYMVEKYKLEPEKIHVIHNAIDIDKYKREGKRKAHKFTVTYVGRLSYEKHPEKIVEIAECFIKKFAVTDICFQIIGDGPMYSQLKRDISDKGLSDNIQLKGYKDDIKEELLTTDILILCSEMEGLPIVILEAMSMSTPCIASNVGGIPELIDDGINGYLVDYDSKMVEIFAARINSLYQDSELINRMGENARKKIESQFSISKMWENYSKIIH